MRQVRKVDILIDGRKFTSTGERIELKVDGSRVYSSVAHDKNNKIPVNDLGWASVKTLLKASDSAFGHVDRFRIVRLLAESSKSFTEIKEMLNATSPTANFHLKTLIDGMIAYKDENGRYALTLLGELILKYFSDFLVEADVLSKTIA